MIPVLDWSRFSSGSDKDGFVRDLGLACRETGFFLLTGHGVDDDLVADVFSNADRFFDLPTAEKAKLDIRNNTSNRGWAAEGIENLDDSKPGQVDAKEAFNIGLDMPADDPRILAGEPFRAVNLWPDLSGFQPVLIQYFNAVHQLGVALHEAIAIDLGLEPHYFDTSLDAPLATLRLLRYPAGKPGDGSIGAGAHTDYGSVTLLMTDAEPGLQVQPRGKDWVDVPRVPGAFVVNIGDCLMRWTNDIYVSTPHRVQTPKNVRRSLAFFLDPNPEAVIKALPGTGEAKYAPVTGADYLRSRLDATYVPEAVE
jgi:isopenicillin N synthase-like dioxygenase